MATNLSGWRYDHLWESSNILECWTFEFGQYAFKGKKQNCSFWLSLNVKFVNKKRRRWRCWILFLTAWGQFHQHAYAQFLRPRIPKAQKDSQVISRKELTNLLCCCTRTDLWFTLCAQVWWNWPLESILPNFFLREQNFFPFFADKLDHISLIHIFPFLTNTLA